jgi:hypothetical protein
MDFVSISREFGLNGLYQIGVISLLFFIIKWVLSFTKEQKKSHDEERRVWHDLDIAKLKVLDSIVESLKHQDEKADERGKYIREEHRDFEQRQREHTKQLGEVCIAIGRINRYKT